MGESKMTRKEEADILREAADLWESGKTLQYRAAGDSSDWEDYKENMSALDLFTRIYSYYEVRIKPEPITKWMNICRNMEGKEYVANEIHDFEGLAKDWCSHPNYLRTIKLVESDE